MRILKFAGILAVVTAAALGQPPAEETVKHVLGTTTYVGSFAGTVLPLGVAGGTVTTFSAIGGGSLFTMGVANPTSTPALTVTISNVAPDTIYGNPSGSTNPPSFSTVSTFLDAVFGATQGTVIYRGATGWAGLAPGTSGQYFETLGSGANPQWNTPSGSGNVITSGTITSGYLAVWSGATSVVADQYLPSGNFPVTVRYFAQMPDIVTPETSATVPWFPNQDYLLAELKAQLADLVDDSRAAEFRANALQKLDRFMKLTNDDEGRAQTLKLDRRRFGTNYANLPNTKNIGWVAFLGLSAKLLAAHLFAVI